MVHHMSSPIFNFFLRCPAALSAALRGSLRCACVGGMFLCPVPLSRRLCLKKRLSRCVYVSLQYLRIFPQYPRAYTQHLSTQPCVSSYGISITASAPSSPVSMPFSHGIYEMLSWIYGEERSNIKIYQLCRVYHICIKGKSRQNIVKMTKKYQYLSQNDMNNSTKTLFCSIVNRHSRV